jgi:isopropylmalate/homocitrate/citramalate synthase
MTDTAVDYNFLPELRRPDTPSDIMLCDVTLRDGEQTMEAAFSTAEKLTVIQSLTRLGIRRVQVGFPQRDAETVRQAKAAGLEPELELYCIETSKDWKLDIDLSLEAGVDVLHFLVRSKEELLNAMGFDGHFVLERTAQCIEYARSQGARGITFGPSHATQTPLEYLIELYHVAADAGADDLLINDSLGLCKPDALGYLVRAIREHTDLPFGVHCHNDYGLGVACSLAGIEAGATRVDVCVNGLGERAGNASLEEVALAAERLLGVKTGINAPELFSVSHQVADLLHMKVPTNKAITGINAFAQKLDIHVEVAKDSPWFFEPYPPELVGGHRYVKLGKWSGPFAVRHKLRDLGITSIDEDVLSGLVEWVNQQAEIKKGDFTEDDFAQHVASVLS